MQGLRRSLFLITLPLATFGYLASIDTANGQIIPDNTLGAEKSIVNTVDVGIPVDLIYGGATRGKNLFHSFREFNVGEGRGSAFYNPTGIENILSRVTGKNPSNIFGLLGVGGNANLFLINPNGIVFGPNARLLMGGSFLASTANSLVFDNGFEFSSTNPQAPPILTVNIPIGLQFRDNPASITNRFVADADNVELQVASGKTLSLVGGDISLDRGRLTAAGGQITLGSLAGAGTVGLNSDGSLSFPDGVARGNVSLTNGAQVDVTAGGGGSVNIYAQNLDILGKSAICAGIGATSTCGNRASDIGSVENKAGDVTLNAFGILTIQGSQVENNVNPNAIGSAGDIKIKASSMNMRDRASLSSSTYGKQDTTGQPSRAGRVLLEIGDALSLENSSYIFNNVEYGGVGQGGDVQIKAGSLSLLNGSQIQTLVRETENNQPPRRGNAGKVNIDVRDAVTIAGVGKDKKPSAVFSNVNTGVIGNSGDIHIMAGSLSLTEGGLLSSSNSGTGDAGKISVQAKDSISLAGIGTAISSEVGSQAQGNAGDITIMARSMSMRDGAELSSSTGAKQDTTGQPSRAGRVLLEIGDALSLENSSYIFNNVEYGGVGQGGDVQIKAGSLSLLNGSQIQTLVRETENNQPPRRGNAGKVNIDVRDAVTIAGVGKDKKPSAVFSAVNTGVIGNSGDIYIMARSMNMRDGATLSSSTYGKQDTTGQLSRAGIISLQVDDALTISGTSNDINRYPSSINSILGQGAIGKGGDINIQAGSLTVKDGARIDSSTAGQQDTSGQPSRAGDVNINVQGTINFSGYTTQMLDGSKQQFYSGISSQVYLGAIGNGGNITIQAGSLSMNDCCSVISNATSGQGNAGKVSVKVDDFIQLADLSNIRSNVEPGGIGVGGDIDIQARSLTLTDGSQILAAVMRQGSGSSAGRGKAGNININATDFVNISGVSSTQYPFADSLNPSKILLTAGYSSGLFASAERGTTAIDIKASGDIKITTGNFLLTNGAVVNTLTSNTGNGGKITINAKTLTATGGGQLLTTTRGSGRAGDISLKISDGITLSGIDPNFNERLTRVEQTIKNSSLNELPRDIVNNQGSASGIFANTSPDSVGDAGTISIDPRTLVIRDRAGIGVNSQGKGKGGNIEINSGNLTLDNNAFISANTASNQGGDIFLTIGDLLLLRRNSNISTNAGTDQAGGDGGNIKIDSDFIAALSSENSDITADAFTGRGGRVEITAKGIFGIKPRNYQTQRSDITASSEFGITGTVTLNTPNVDPSHGLVELPKNVVDPTEQIAQNPCQRGVGSKFIITGRGGLPPSPNEATSSDAVRVDLVEPAPGRSGGAGEQRRITSPSLRDATRTETLTRTSTLSGQGAEEKGKSSVAKSIVPAQGWIFDKNGEVMLTGYDPTGTGLQRLVNSDVCPVP
ncbi:filamentous hemagglutinin N-terminal domain-containing protein [Nostoc spongiaeforme FACHB-130]|uniref:Filamentous hemagglutinin N-terminal domain-containing protein n=1 Tax=Nostoc spongiaeforme FACHB-130 TaxID=1357510 RepID=A0ABR8FNG6_9NOSO|nr:filamentous hemagglutinin N-terminal domain-containing protein [Nostoc spongiaeforme]MBD2592942.1 filamentous hemagglutinin N-terminal domain-containing protein [Nostoc spongiaeforme FACHB-130]